jgi:hypothetical protein
MQHTSNGALARGSKPQGNTTESRRAGLYLCYVPLTSSALALAVPSHLVFLHWLMPLTGYISKNYRLPICRKDPRGHHSLVHLGSTGRSQTQTLCAMCRYLQQQAKQRPGSQEARIFCERERGTKRVHKTGFACSHCEMAPGIKASLCKDGCFKLWHEL